MLWNEAIRLAHRQEQNHGLIDSHGVTPLRQRMIDDMRMRKLEPKTQASLHPRRAQARRLPRGARPTPPRVEDLRRFQLHLVDQRHLADHAQRDDHRA